MTRNLLESFVAPQDISEASNRSKVFSPKSTSNILPSSSVGFLKTVKDITTVTLRRMVVVVPGAQKTMEHGRLWGRIMDWKA